MFFSGFDEETNERLVRDAGLTILESRLEPMQEPDSEPERGTKTRRLSLNSRSEVSRVKRSETRAILKA
jgi:hypothetical protein